MASRLPLIVGFGGYNAAGRSSGHRAYQRTILESLGADDRKGVLSSLAALMGHNSSESFDEQAVLNGTLVRKIEAEFFDAEAVPTTVRYALKNEGDSTSFVSSRRNLPDVIPDHWSLEHLDEEGKQVRVRINTGEDIRLDAKAPMDVKSAGQLPSGFDPGAHYRSLHHPRGLQMAVLGASDAVRSMGIEWKNIANIVSPDRVAVYSSSIMSQLDGTGFGGLFNGRLNGNRTSSKQIAMGLNTMPADFINAYVLGSLGATGGTTGACATFLYNLRQGVEEIRSGRRDVVVVGASEAPILPEIIDGYNAMGALATEVALKKLDGANEADFRRASRPFGENCGFTIAESSQYVVLMSDALALETGAEIYGAVPGVYVNADGFKKSISAPGAGNYITMAKAMGLTRNLLGEDALRAGSFIQAHGSSTPQNRVTESKIFDVLANTFDIQNWPVSAVKSYVGHSLAAASGDQLVSTLGIFAHGILPGVKTVTDVASDVYADRLNIALNDVELAPEQRQVAFLNSKGFGGNNATAAVFSPEVAMKFIEKNHGKNGLSSYSDRNEEVKVRATAYQSQADAGSLNPIYEFGTNLIDEGAIDAQRDSIKIPGYEVSIALDDTEGFDPL